MYKKLPISPIPSINRVFAPLIKYLFSVINNGIRPIENAVQSSILSSLSLKELCFMCVCVWLIRVHDEFKTKHEIRYGARRSMDRKVSVFNINSRIVPSTTSVGKLLIVAMVNISRNWPFVFDCLKYARLVYRRDRSACHATSIVNTT